MKKVYHLSTCDTSRGIIKEYKLVEKGFELQDIKTEKISPAQLEEMKNLTGSYEALFSRRALKYKDLGLKEMSLGEKEYRKYILEEYTFLKRPVIICDNKIFVGSEKKNMEELKNYVG